jgi:hypothetical protein
MHHRLDVGQRPPTGGGIGKVGGNVGERRAGGAWRHIP